MKLLQTTFFSGIITLIRIGSGFVANKVVAIYTGASGIALIGAFTNFLSIVLAFANGAINTGVVKYTAEYHDNEEDLKSLFSTAFKISLFCSSIVGVFLIIFASFFSNFIFFSIDYKNTIRVLGISIILYSLNSLFISILNGKQQIKKYTIVNTAGSIIGLVFTLILVFYFKLIGAIYALVLSQSIVFFITLTIVIKSEWFSMNYFNQKIDVNILKKLSHYSMMAIVTALTAPISQIVLRNMIISSLGMDAAGIWQGMMRISDGYLMVLTTAFATYYLPKLASLHTDEELRIEIFKGYKLILPTVLISCVCIYFLRFLIIRLLFTPNFFEMSNLFFFQLIGDFFKMASWILAYLMLAKSMTRSYIITEVLFALIYIVLGFVCVKWLNIVGISVAFAITYFIYFLVIFYIFRNVLFKKHIIN